jgi:predicted nucleic acid-binding protein
MKYVIDTSAWIEYFIGSKKGESVKLIIDNSHNEKITPEPVIAELYSWSDKEGMDFSKLLELVVNNSSMESISFNDWLDAAKIKILQRKTKKDFGLIDSLFVAIQMRLHAKLLTGDSHFKNMKDVVLI